MATVLRLVGYATVLALAFGAASSVGAATGTPAWSRAAGPAPTEAPETRPAVPAPTPAPARPDPDPGDGGRGLAAHAAGYTLVLDNPAFLPDEAGELAFAVTGPDGRPVTAFEVRNEQPMHAVVVRRDAAGYQQLSPALGSDGRWRAPLVLPAGGVYRLYADFVPSGGPPLVLGTDLFAAGAFAPIPFAPSRVAQIDGYQVRLDGDLVPGNPSQVFATVSRDGAAVTDLQPYRGAFGQLLALRRTDLAYVRARPDAVPLAGTDRSGPGIAFTAQVPSTGSYRLFLDFRHGRGVHTAEFTVETRDGT
jgi:hypothetical protein